MILKEFQSQKKLLLKTFDDLEKFGFIPYEFNNIEYSKEWIDNHKKSLEDENFFISICGAIKSGKSTLINRWLFEGKDILPTDDSICTATISKIQYDDKQYAKAYFYNKKEWEELKNTNINEVSTKSSATMILQQNVSYFEKYLQTEVNKSASKGIYPEHIIKNEGMIKTVYKLDDLKEYSAKGGKFTPFVKYIEIFINNEDIKNVIVVDTPGTNDPNIHREGITKKWIDQSNAVIMLMYAGQAFTKHDLNFIDKNLSTIPSDKIIFVLSKSDLIGNYKNVKNYVENNLRKNKDIKDRYLLKNNKEVYPISAISSIIRMKKNNDIELNEDEKILIENSETIDEFIENDGYLPTFYKAVDNYLMKDKGKAILEKAKKEIIMICQNRINKFNHDIEISLKKYDTIGKSEEEINKEINKIKELRDRIDKLKGEYNKKTGKNITDIKNDLDRKIIPKRRNIYNEYESWVENNNANTVINLSVVELNNFFEDAFIANDFFDKIFDKKLVNELKETNHNFIKDIKDITKHTIPSRMEYIFQPNIELEPLLKNVRKVFEEKLSPETLNGLREHILFITEEQPTKKKILRKVEQALQKIGNEISGIVKNQLNIYQKDNGIVISEKVEGILNEISDQMEELKDKKMLNIQEEKKEIEKNIKKMESSKKNFENKFISIKKQLEEL